MEAVHKKIFANLDMFRVLEESARVKFLAQATHFHRTKGGVVCLAGEPAHNLFVVVSGWIKIFRETLDGEEAVLDVVSTGSFFGEDAAFDGDLYQMNAEVVEDAEIMTFPIALLKEQIEKDPIFARATLSYMTQKKQLREREVEHLSVQNAPQRIGCFLLRLAGPDAIEKASFDLPFDKTLIAAKLGMQPETFSRALAKLRHETGVHIKGARVSIDEVEKLSTYACSACSSEFPCKDLTGHKC